MAFQTKRTYSIIISVSLVLSLLGATHVFDAEASSITVIDYEFRDLERNIFNYWLGIGGLAAGGGGVFLFSIWYYQRRYH